MNKQKLRETAEKINKAINGEMKKGQCYVCGEDLLWQESKHDICQDCADRYGE